MQNNDILLHNLNIKGRQARQGFSKEIQSKAKLNNAPAPKLKKFPSTNLKKFKRNKEDTGSKDKTNAKHGDEISGQQVEVLKNERRLDKTTVVPMLHLKIPEKRLRRRVSAAVDLSKRAKSTGNKSKFLSRNNEKSSDTKSITPDNVLDNKTTEEAPKAYTSSVFADSNLMGKMHADRIKIMLEEIGVCKHNSMANKRISELLKASVELLIEMTKSNTPVFRAASVYSLSDVLALCHRVCEVFASEETLLITDFPLPRKEVVVCSDIHGCMDILLRIFKEMGSPPNEKIIFLGDDDAQILLLIFSFKIYFIAWKS
uniref:Protein-serine/threonine phosphatase n=1 Tax=Rhabditophanes sp. KR3021 TaxID=114890 RepID=A0AC35U0C5_9BILA